MRASLGDEPILQQLVAQQSFKQLTCSVCCDIFRDPVITPCSHSFCRGCILTAIQVSERCPLCRGLVSASSLRANLSLADLVRELRCFCKYHKYGCGTELTLDEKAGHEAACSYAPLKCKYAARGCLYSGTAGELSDHLQHCPYEQLRGFLDSLESRFEAMQRQISEQATQIVELRKLLSQTAAAAAAAVAASSHSPQQQSAAAVRSLSASQPSVPVGPPQAGVDVGQFECVAVTANAHHSGITALLPLQLDRGKYLLFSGSHDARLKMWTLEDGVFRLNGDIEAHKYTIWGFVRHEDTIFSASADGRILSWDMSNLHLKPRQPMEHQAKVYCLAGKGDLLFSGSADRTIKVWDLRQSPSSPVIATLNGHTRSVWSLKIGARAMGSTLLSAGNCGTVNIWEMRTWTARKKFNYENHEALAVDCSPDGAYVFAGSSTSKVYAFDTLTGEMTHRLSGHQWEVWQLARIGEGPQATLLSGSYDHKIIAWSMDFSTGFQMRKALVGHKGAVHSLQTCGDVAFSGSGDKTIRVWGAPSATDEAL